MMVSALLTVEDFDEAVLCAQEAGQLPSGAGLGSPLDGSWLGRIAQVWDRIEEALQTAFLYGREGALALAEAAAEAAEKLLHEAGTRARDVQQALLARLSAYADKLVEGALKKVRPNLTVGETKLPLTGVEISQKVTMTGSLKANITDLVALTGAGEITVLARYGTAAS